MVWLSASLNAWSHVIMPEGLRLRYLLCGLVLSDMMGLSAFRGRNIEIVWMEQENYAGEIIRTG